jgi:outer membrane protein assembly factor BamB
MKPLVKLCRLRHRRSQGRPVQKRTGGGHRPRKCLIGNGRGGVLTVTGGIVYVTTSSGHLIAIADTRVRPPAGHQCTDEFINPGSVGPGWKAVCRAHGYRVVRSPRILKDVALPDGVDAANLRSEPAFADGNVYVATSGGHVYAVWPQ